MKIKINKIFGKYNTEIDLDKEINIFIGENGIGKSTSIKILNKLFKLDYIGLLNYYFNSIEIENDDEVVTIEYSDLTIDKDILLKLYIEKEYSYTATCKDNYLMYKEIKKDFELKRMKDSNVIPDSMDVIKKNENYEVYQEYFDNYAYFARHYEFELFLNKLNNRILYKILKNNDQLLKNELIIKEFDDVSYYLNFIRKIYEQYKNNFVEIDDTTIDIFDEYLRSTKFRLIYKNIMEIIRKIGYESVCFVDMASNFNITNDLNRIYINNELDIYNEKRILPEYQGQLQIFGLFEDEKKYQKDIFDLIFKEYKDINYCNKLKENYHKILVPKINDNDIDFGYFLFDKIYTDKKIEEFKNDFYDFINKFSNEFDILEQQKYTYQLLNKIKLYIRPLISKKNIIGTSFDSIWYYTDSKDSKEYEYLESYGWQFFCAFYEKYKDKYFDIKNEKLELLNGLFKKYFTNKDVIATPFGISISTKDYENDINFEELSAGEKKIIILFTLIVFSDNSIILLDEPEASLSIVWQRDLLPDILLKTKYNKLIVATQSPFIVSDNELEEYLVCLPMESIDE